MTKTKWVASSAAVAVALILPVVMQAEGLRTQAYKDYNGVPTLCYGSTSGVAMGDTATPEECEILLQGELLTFAESVDRYIVVTVTPETHAALASFAYNVGIGAFRKSTLLRKLNAGDYTGACNELRRWVYSGGDKLPGLVRRREIERSLCLAGLQ